MTMETIYLVCFIVGLVLSVLSVAGGFAHLHLGHLHVGHAAHTHTRHAHGPLRPSTASPSLPSSAGSEESATCSIATASSSRR